MIQGNFQIVLAHMATYANVLVVYVWMYRLSIINYTIQRLVNKNVDKMYYWHFSFYLEWTFKRDRGCRDHFDNLNYYNKNSATFTTVFCYTGWDQISDWFLLQLSEGKRHGLLTNKKCLYAHKTLYLFINNRINFFLICSSQHLMWFMMLYNDNYACEKPQIITTH